MQAQSSRGESVSPLQKSLESSQTFMEDIVKTLTSRAKNLEDGLQDTQFTLSQRLDRIEGLLTSIFLDISQHGRHLAHLETKLQLRANLSLDQEDHLHAKSGPEHANKTPQDAVGESLHAKESLVVGMLAKGVLAEQRQGSHSQIDKLLKQSLELLLAEVAALQVEENGPEHAKEKPQHAIEESLHAKEALVSEMLPEAALVEPRQGSHRQIEERSAHSHWWLQQLRDQTIVAEFRELTKKFEHLQAEVATLRAGLSEASENKSA